MQPEAVRWGAMPVQVHRFGAQLRDLQLALCDPLEQATHITFLGDSITWGSNLPENSAHMPRAGKLSDARDHFASPSFVNEFKRFVGRQYFHDAPPVLENWPDSPGGEASARFERTERLFTASPPCRAPVTHAGGEAVQRVQQDSLLGMVHRLTLADARARVELDFDMTGTGFDLVFSTAPGAADYELLVDGVSQGRFSTAADQPGRQQRRHHVFDYVRKRRVTLRALYPRQANGAAHLELEALEIRKSCTILNQGIIGADCRIYMLNNLTGDGPIAVSPEVNHVFVQLGTNDRISYFPRYGQANSVSTLASNLQELVSRIKAVSGAAVILMCAGPVHNESPATYSFNMQQVRSTVTLTGRRLGLDVIDHYGLFDGMAISEFTADGLHPNRLGHAMMARNLIGALTSA